VLARPPAWDGRRRRACRVTVDTRITEKVHPSHLGAEGGALLECGAGALLQHVQPVGVGVEDVQHLAGQRRVR
jgi:hypothetical protein